MFSRLPIKSFRTLFLQRAFSSNEMTVKNPKNHQKNLPQKNKDKEQEKM